MCFFPWSSKEDATFSHVRNILIRKLVCLSGARDSAANRIDYAEKCIFSCHYYQVLCELHIKGGLNCASETEIDQGETDKNWLFTYPPLSIETKIYEFLYSLKVPLVLCSHKRPDFPRGAGNKNVILYM